MGGPIEKSFEEYAKEGEQVPEAPAPAPVNPPEVPAEKKEEV